MHVFGDQVQKHLQMRIEAQGKYMQTILQKACQTLGNENPGTCQSYKGTPNQLGLMADQMKDLNSPINFPSLEDLNLYNSSGSDQLEIHQNIDRFPIETTAFQANNLALGKKRPNPNNTYNVYNSKSPLTIWSDDHNQLQLQLDHFNGAASDHPFPSTDEMKLQSSLGDHYHGVGDHSKKFDASAKLERPSPRRVPLERTNSMSKAHALPSSNLSYT